MKRRAADLGITQQIVWHGFVADRASIYNQMDICVVPSRVPEALPTVAIEAAFFGLPVVASNRGGLPEIVEDGVTGLLAEAEKPRQLASKLFILLQNPELRLQLGRAGRARAKEYFSRERFANDFMKVLEQ